MVFNLAYKGTKIMDNLECIVEFFWMIVQTGKQSQKYFSRNYHINSKYICNVEKSHYWNTGYIR